MQFKEAMIALRNGSKVTREPWTGSVYFYLNGEDVKSYQPKLSAYNYNEDIMISNGWIVEGIDGEHNFYDIIDYLKSGKRAKMKDWKEKYIYVEGTIKSLVIHAMEEFPFMVDFISFSSSDWMILE